MTLQDLQRMKATDIRTVDPETLAYIAGAKVNTDLPVFERMVDAAGQMNGNLYCFKSKSDTGADIIVKIGFADTSVRLNDSMENYMRTL